MNAPLRGHDTPTEGVQATSFNELTASHEAAHVVVALALRLPVFAATVVPTDKYNGKTDIGDRKTSRRKGRRSLTFRVTDSGEAYRHVAVFLAGYVYERRFLLVPRRVAVRGADNDIANALRFRQQWRFSFKLALEILSSADQAVDEMSEMLLSRGLIDDGRTFYGFARRWSLEDIGLTVESGLCKRLSVRGASASSNGTASAPSSEVESERAARYR